VSRSLIQSIGMVVCSAVTAGAGLLQEKAAKGCQEGSDRTTESSAQSYIWIDYTHRDRPLQYWMIVEGIGEVWYVRYDNQNRIERGGVTYPQVLESKSGSFPSGDIQTLFEFVEGEGLLELKSNYDGEGVETLSEDDILRVHANLRDETKSVTARPPSFCPERLANIVRVIQEMAAGLEEDGRYGVFLRAEALNEARAEKLRGKSEVFFLSEGEVKAHRVLGKTIENAGQFTYVGSWENTGIDRCIGTRNFIVVETSDGEFQIDIFLRERRSKVQ